MDQSLDKCYRIEFKPYPDKWTYWRMMGKGYLKWFPSYTNKWGEELSEVPTLYKDTHNVVPISLDQYLCMKSLILD